MADGALATGAWKGGERSSRGDEWGGRSWGKSVQGVGEWGEDLG